MIRTVDRWAFLAGVGTLTAMEIAEWAGELGARPEMPSDVNDMDHLMVASTEFADRGAMWRAEVDR